MAPPRPAALCPDPRPPLGAGPGAPRPALARAHRGAWKPAAGSERAGGRGGGRGWEEQPADPGAGERAPERRRAAGERSFLPLRSRSALGRRRPALFRTPAPGAGAPGRSPSRARPGSHERPPREPRTGRFTNIYRVPTGCPAPGRAPRGCGRRNPSRPWPLRARSRDREGGGQSDPWDSFWG
ncbi:unnamed protein product [Nyctereutes procyonoides]|uniref:(raccoon dog) hypothetical protein n=1 Tax=Nyctereutes procyonoides TaxID=34880 RepID=A0A811XV07_NYCPR|nr:unnamed protein product [Nyctereutes procyonoides]